MCIYCVHFCVCLIPVDIQVLMVHLSCRRWNDSHLVRGVWKHLYYEEKSWGITLIHANFRWKDSLFNSLNCYFLSLAQTLTNWLDFGNWRENPSRVYTQKLYLGVCDDDDYFYWPTVIWTFPFCFLLIFSNAKNACSYTVSKEHLPSFLFVNCSFTHTF